MKLAACNEMFGDESWAQTCQAIKECGYDGVEIAPFTFAPSVLDVDAKQRQSIRDAAEAAGLDIIGLHWLLAKTEGYHLTHPDPSVREATSRYVEALVDFCADLGGRVLVFGSPAQRNLQPGVDFSQGLAWAASALESPSRRASKRGVVIAFEPLSPAETNFCKSAAEARQLIEKVGEPGLRLHLDAKAMAAEDQPMDAIVKAHADVLEHVHVNDVNLLGPGMGDLDLWPMISALHEVGYQGYYSVEVFETGPGPRQILVESKAYLESLARRLP